MYCRYCRKELPDWMLVCPYCGQRPPWGGRDYCYRCGKWTGRDQDKCAFCAATLIQRTPSTRSRFVAVLFALFLGMLGAHRFYLGYYRVGATQLILCILTPVTCGLSLSVAVIWGLWEAYYLANGGLDEDAEGRTLLD